MRQKLTGIPQFMWTHLTGVVLISTLITGFSALWSVAGRYEKHLLEGRRIQVETRLAVYGNVLTNTLNLRMVTLAALEEFARTHPDENAMRSRFEAFAAGLYSGKDGLRAIQIFPPAGKILVYPRTGNEASLERSLQDLISDERAEVRKDVRLAMKTRSMVISGPYRLRQGGFGLVSRKPIYHGETFLGLAVAVIDLDPVLNIAGLLQSGRDRLTIALREPPEPAFWGKNTVWDGDPVTYPILFQEESWELAAVPEEGWRKSILNSLIVFWMTGSCIVLLAGGLSFSITRRQTRLSILVKERTALLEESQRKYQQLYYTNPDAFFVFNTNGRILHANPAACRHYGYTEAEIHRLSIADLTVHPPEKKAHELLEQAVSGINSAAKRHVRKDGTQFDAEINGLPVFFKNRPCVSITVRDISERRQAEEKLAASENRYKSLIESMPSGFAVHEMIYDAQKEPKDYRFLEINEAFEQLTGLKAENIIGKTALEILTERESIWIEKFGQVALTGQPVRFKNYSEKLGRYYEVVAYAPAENQFAAIFNDISGRQAAEKQRKELHKSLEEKVRKQTEELRLRVDESERLNRAMMNLLDDLKTSNRELELTSERLTEANRELEAFSYSVSHDLRAPLRGIDGFSMALQEDCSESLDDQGKHYLTRIRKATNHMGTLIDDLLRLSRISRAELQSIPIDLSAMAAEIAEGLKASSPGRTVDIRIQQNIRVNADPRLMHIALENLLGNAFKFTAGNEDARIEFECEQVDDETVFRIIDNGDGFDIRYADKLFNPFQRLHRADEFEGTGIGLSIVKRIIQRHQGRIWAESTVGKGASFFFTLHGKNGETC